MKNKSLVDSVSAGATRPYRQLPYHAESKVAPSLFGNQPRFGDAGVDDARWAVLTQQLLDTFQAQTDSDKRRAFLRQLLLQCRPAELSLLHSHVTATSVLKVDFISQLPAEIAVAILSMLPDGRSVVRAGRVSKAWHRLVHRENDLWRRVCARNRWSPIAPWRRGDELILWAAPSLARVTREWKTVYIDNYLTRTNWTSGRYTITHATLHAEDNSISRRRTLNRPQHNNSHQDTMNSMCLSFDAELHAALSVSIADRNAPAKVWSLPTGKARLDLRTDVAAVQQPAGIRHVPANNNLRDAPPAQQQQPEALSLSVARLSTHLIVGGGINGIVYVWDARTGQHLKSLVGHTDEVNCVQIVDGTNTEIVSGSADGTIRQWYVRTGECLAVLRGHVGSVTCAQWVPAAADNGECLIVSGGSDMTICIWSALGRTCRATLAGHTADVLCLQADAKHIASGSADRTIKLWNQPTGACIRTLEGHLSAVVCLQFDHDKLVSGGADCTVKVWSFPHGSLLYSMQHHTGAIWNLRFDRTKLVTSSFDCTVRVCNFNGMDTLSDAQKRSWGMLDEDTTGQDGDEDDMGVE